MNIEITDEKLSQLVEAEVRKQVANRITQTMNDGKAFWFTEQNIERITYECIMSKIQNDMVCACIQSLDKKKVIEAFTSSLAKQLTETLFYDFIN